MQKTRLLISRRLIEDSIFWCILVIPYFKKLLFSLPFVVPILSVLSVVILFRLRIRKEAFILSVIIMCYYTISGFDKGYLYMLAAMWPFMISRLFTFSGDRSNLLGAFFLTIIVAYAFWQNYIGYSSFEIKWFESGIGGAGTGYLAFEDIRPTSFLAGSPELAFLFSCFSIYFVKFSRLSLAFIFGGLVIFVGVRGIIIGYFLSLMFMFFGLERRKLFFIFFPIILTPILYVLLYGFSELLSLYTGDFGRVSVYGTFMARANIVIEFMSSISFWSMLVGVYSNEFVYDNYWLVLIDKFGVFGIVAFLFFLGHAVKSASGKILVVMYLSYAFFADVGYYFYFSLIIVYFDSLFRKSELSYVSSH